MSRVKVDWRSASKENYLDYCKNNPKIEITFKEWASIVEEFNESIREHILETGDKVALPFRFGEITIIKKKRKKVNVVGDKTFINLPIDWKKTKEKGKVIYNFNYHTEGFFFGWKWFRSSVHIKQADLWYFKPSRKTSRSITEYLNKDPNYQHIYKQW